MARRPYFPPGSALVVVLGVMSGCGFDDGELVPALFCLGRGALTPAMSEPRPSF